MGGIAHGTYAGWSKCRLHSSGPCTECGEARSAYQRVRRATKPSAYRSELELKAARTQAWRRLAGMYPDAFRALLEEELQRRQEAA